MKTYECFIVAGDIN